VNDTSEVPQADRTPPLLEEERLEALLWAIAGEIKANMQDGVTSDHGWLYDDETGLPA
jgi:antitoxin VapB